MSMETPESLERYPAPAPEPRARTLWIALALLVFTLALAVAVTVAAVTGDLDPIFGATPASAGDDHAAAFSPAPPPPKIAPVEYLDVTPETAKQINDSVPFTTEPVPPAAPLSAMFQTPEDQQRATDCLAAAAWYEAGNDPVGQSAVVQVVLNRLRHAAFPKTVCEVVFQGSERKTGCQFTFTCDGSMIRRKPAPDAWMSAQGIALTALRGVVFSRVGWATHYHTDWVVPNWSSSVDKVAAVDTHLFFRWRGANGRPGAFGARHAGVEPRIPKMTGLSPAHTPQETAALPDAMATSAPSAPSASDERARIKSADVNLRGTTLARANASENLYVIRLEPGQLTGSTALIGVELCADARTACTVAGFTGTPGRAIARPLGRVDFPDRPPDFYYFVDRSRSRERILWNCKLVSRPKQSQCLPQGFRAEG